MPDLNYSYDRDSDIITIEGIRYSGDFFRSWAPSGLPEGRLFQIGRRADHAFEIIDRGRDSGTPASGESDPQ